jgi:hypothetical protein
LAPSPRGSPERRHAAAPSAPKPLAQEGVPDRKPSFIGVYVTQADGTRVFRPQP